jgi:hypothetical protein
MTNPNVQREEPIENPGENKVLSTLLSESQFAHGIMLRLTGTPITLETLAMIDAETKEAQPTYVLAVATELFKYPAILDNLNFQSSLLGGSEFFGKVLRAMGELADKDLELSASAKLPVCIRLVEHYRRGGDAKKMRTYAERVKKELQQKILKNDALAQRQLAKVLYEESMQAYGQKKYTEAIKHGEESIALCEKAGDAYGIMAARGNTAGLFRYELSDTLQDPVEQRNLLDHGQPILERDVAWALEMMERDPNQGQNYQRVLMNNAAHLLEIAKRKKDSNLGKTFAQLLQENDLFNKALEKGVGWAKNIAENIQAMQAVTD